MRTTIQQSSASKAPDTCHNPVHKLVDGVDATTRKVLSQRGVSDRAIRSIFPTICVIILIATQPAWAYPVDPYYVEEPGNNSILEGVTGAAKGVGSWFSGAASTVASIFTSPDYKARLAAERARPSPPDPCDLMEGHALDRDLCHAAKHKGTFGY